eukprot:14016-Heterococcus_DN1.PRE.1
MSSAPKVTTFEDGTISALMSKAAVTKCVQEQQATSLIESQSLKAGRLQLPPSYTERISAQVISFKP